MRTESGWIEKEDVLNIIDEVDKLSTVKRIALKRCCGKLLKDANMQAIMAFYQVYSLPGKFDRAKDCLFAVACMRCMWDTKEKKEDGKQERTEKEDEGKENEGKEEKTVTFEKALYRKRKEFEKEGFMGWSGMERRLLRLLDRKWDKDGILCMDLWRMVKQMKNEGHIIDMASLGLDLCYWNAESRKVQQRWLQVCYQEKKEEEENAD